MPADHGVESLTLTLPPEPAYVGLARLFAAAAARRFGVEEDRVEDVKAAISEACAVAVRDRSRSGKDEPLAITIEHSDGSVTFAVPEAGSAEAQLGSQTDDLIESLGIELIVALFPEASTDNGIRFSIEV